MLSPREWKKPCDEVLLAFLSCELRGILHAFGSGLGRVPTAEDFAELTQALKKRRKSFRAGMDIDLPRAIVLFEEDHQGGWQCTSSRCRHFAILEAASERAVRLMPSLNFREMCIRGETVVEEFLDALS